MRYALYVLYKYYDESKRDTLIAFEKSKMVLSLLLGLNLSTLSFLILPDWILDSYLGPIFLLSIGCLYILLSIFIKEKSITQQTKHYKGSHKWLFLLYIIFSLITFSLVVMSDFNPNYKRKQQRPKQTNVKEVFIEFKPDTVH